MLNAATPPHDRIEVGCFVVPIGMSAAALAVRRPEPRATAQIPSSFPIPVIPLFDDQAPGHPRLLVSVHGAIEVVPAGGEIRRDRGDAAGSDRGASLRDPVSEDRDSVL